MYVGIAFKSLFHIIYESNADIRIVTTNPFYLPLFIKIISSRRCKVIYTLWDLFPDALVISNYIKSKGAIANILTFLTKQTLKSVDATVFLGDKLRNYVENKYQKPKKSMIIHVGADGSPFKDNPPQQVSSNHLKIIYSGNLGKMHDIKTLKQYITRKDLTNTEIHFYASGNGLNILKNETNNPNVVFGSKLPNKEWIKTMLSFPISLITVTPGAENVVMPSKFYSAMVAGQAILAICPEESDLAQLVKENNCGWIIKNYDIEGLNSLLKSLHKNPEEIQQKRLSAFKRGHEKYDMRAISNNWSNLISEL